MSNPKKTVVVFGATGTLGLYFVDYLAGHLGEEWQIVATGRRPSVEFAEARSGFTRKPPTE